MNNTLNSFRLIGYKINELSNGNFVIQRPDGRHSLVDSDGNIIIGNAAYIDSLSDVFYRVLEDSESNIGILYDNKGNIVDKAEYSRIAYIRNLIQVRHIDSNGNAIFNIYEENDRVRFKNIYGEGYAIIEDGCKYKLMYTDTEGNRIILDSRNTQVIVPIHEWQIVTINKHYLRYSTGDFNSQAIMDYRFNVILEGQKLEIDTTNTQSSNIIHKSIWHISILDRNGKVIANLRDTLSNEDYYEVDKVKFTSEPNIVLIETFNDIKYLFNIVTKQKSNKYNDIDVNSFVGRLSQECSGLDYIDRKTLNSTQVLSNCYRIFKFVDTYVIRRHVDSIEEYYTLDLKPLVHEYD